MSVGSGDRLLNYLTIATLICTGVLLFGSAMNHVVDLQDGNAIATVWTYVGCANLVLSSLLVIFNLLLTRHPFHEYWVVALLGGVVGAAHCT